MIDADTKNARLMIVMKPSFHVFLEFVVALSLIAVAIEASPQGGAGEKPAPTTGATPAEKRVRGKAATKSGRGSVERIDGRWWSDGNDFCVCDVVFTQNGSSISGLVTYTDGRTAHVTGALVGKNLEYSWTNANGDHGTGRLEQSWHNFLGGKWHNQKGGSGSWTLDRIEGTWCFRGIHNQVCTITHDSTGRVSVVTEKGVQQTGRIDIPKIILEPPFENLTGTIYFKGNRIDWSNGEYWTWCGP